MQLSNTHNSEWKQTGKWISFIMLFFALESCANDSTQAVDKKLIGHWQIKDFQMPGLPAEDTAMIDMIQQAGTGKDRFGYMNFKPGGKVDFILMGQSETLNYRVSSDTLIIITMGGQPNEPMLISFSGKDTTAQITNLKGEKVYILQRTSN